MEDNIFDFSTEYKEEMRDSMSEFLMEQYDLTKDEANKVFEKAWSLYCENPEEYCDLGDTCEDLIYQMF